MFANLQMSKGIENSSIVFYHLLDTTKLLILINIDFIDLWITVVDTQIFHQYGRYQLQING